MWACIVAPVAAGAGADAGADVDAGVGVDADEHHLGWLADAEEADAEEMRPGCYREGVAHLC